MTFKQFITTKKFTSNLSNLTDEIGYNVAHAFYYLDDPNIFVRVNSEGYHLIVGNQEIISTDLLKVEKELYDCVIGE